MRWFVIMLVGCGFAPRVSPPGDDVIDAPVDDSGHVIDARPIDAPADARICPTAPAGCTRFTCAATSSCYYTCTPNASWTNAAMACATNNVGCLATISNQAEQDCLTLATVPIFPDIVWFGWVQATGSIEPGGGWGWKCGASTYLAPNWGMFEPNNQGGHEDCGALNNGGAWIDGDCSTKARYVCEL